MSAKKYSTDYKEYEGNWATIFNSLNLFGCMNAKDRYMAHHKIYVAQHFGFCSDFFFDYRNAECGVYSKTFREVHVSVVSRDWEAYKDGYQINPIAESILKEATKAVKSSGLRVALPNDSTGYAMWDVYSRMAFLKESGMKPLTIIKTLELNNRSQRLQDICMDVIEGIPPKREPCSLELGRKVFIDAAQQAAKNE